MSRLVIFAHPIQDGEYDPKRVQALVVPTNTSLKDAELALQQHNLTVVLAIDNRTLDLIQPAIDKGDVVYFSCPSALCEFDPSKIDIFSETPGTPLEEHVRELNQSGHRLLCMIDREVLNSIKIAQPTPLVNANK